MSSKTVDVLIFIPLIPVFPVLFLWLLPGPGGRWILRKVPKRILGPYLLYCAFAAWHFGMPWWASLLAALWGVVVSGIALSQALEARRVKGARDWPVAQSLFLHIQDVSEKDSHETKLTVTYTYKVKDMRYAGTQSLVFTKAEDAARFRERYNERTVPVHYRPEKPEVSALVLETKV